MSLKGAAEEYFSNLNPIASRIYSDFNEVKSSYEELWSTIAEKEQQAILSESIIKPEVSLKYVKNTGQSPKTDYAVKLVFDDNCSYRDEHSGPFSFKSRSQRDLRIFESDSRTVPPEDQLKHTKHKKKLVQPALMTRKREEDSKDLNEQEISCFLPKTGLDFLDNW